MLAALRLAAAPSSSEVVEALTKAVDDPHQFVAEASLGSLVRVRPDDLEGRLVRLFRTTSRKSRVRGDGPIQRHLLYHLSRCPGDEATEVIREAVLDSGEGDANPAAISGWAAHFYRERRAEAEARAVFERALESEYPHVVKSARAHLDSLGRASGQGE